MVFTIAIINRRGIFFRMIIIEGIYFWREKTLPPE
ncbi:hypothetical protein P296_01015 [Salmonella enterica subsp. arizonae serovar 18:z4,z23:- str. CVM N26624]|uniref:Uncharacterized protein n=1 Tax=Salmonella enterica subsp. arizonae serovar 18:z4,z23:- str. CVM N26626 TaxID=1395119 RepID=A0A3S5YJB4_SALER|nr:hypothetical protein P297_07645 [Salmonella enterica subsp. arizonae serovar 18:z4,z23:- str. CVM N26625]OLV98576.1 hypothetical protein P296_01015 [Salmonella enterica subsp. arizonae serovar 18:z4,z23:- str. CVM N26624]OLV99093.1 hypothetical protein P298_00865 [Salmonella enterica subsp. arizonae serovar 18:z4,z23:- str. CVM N26626]OLW12027.1 hypothetical protein P295_09995 [Salmonella enterica subsp. arizonae serovar 18:z4,z23:- str. CVM N25373]OLW13482.1 hypothetical protein P293_12820 